MKKKTKNQIVTSTDHLIELIQLGHTNYALSLKNSLFSRKTITYKEKSKRFSITNHIDDTQQNLTKLQLINKDYSNIGRAISSNALIAIINEQKNSKKQKHTKTI